jgi:plasmid stabilization system protein ParE
MKYRVIVQPPAELDIEAAYLYLRAQSHTHAERWLTGIERAIESLASLPNRCGLARESREFSIEVRQLLYGKRSGRYRILFIVQDEEVRILHVRHGARDRLSGGEI